MNKVYKAVQKVKVDGEVRHLWRVATFDFLTIGEFPPTPMGHIYLRGYEKTGKEAESMAAAAHELLLSLQDKRTQPAGTGVLSPELLQGLPDDRPVEVDVTVEPALSVGGALRLVGDIAAQLTAARGEYVSCVLFSTQGVVTARIYACPTTLKTVAGLSPYIRSVQAPLRTEIGDWAPPKSKAPTYHEGYDELISVYLCPQDGESLPDALHRYVVGKVADSVAETFRLRAYEELLEAAKKATTRQLRGAIAALEEK